MKRITSIELRGVLGRAIRLSCDNRLKKIDYDFMVIPFRERSERDNAWRCEFWGKVTRSAILTNHWLHDAELTEKIRETVQSIIACQDETGCISSYPAENQASARGWDIWGRKYVLLTLLRYYRLVEPDAKVLHCCCRMVEHLMTQIGPEAKNILDCGCHGGLASSSILVAIVELYSLTHEKKYLDYARWISDTGCSNEGSIYEAALAGVTPAAIGNSKAYELTSCFEGLASLYRYIPDSRYYEACSRYFQALIDREIFVTGVGGLRDRWGELWYDGALRQTMPGCGSRGETCVTATWLHYCHKMMELMPESTLPLIQAERTIYNGMLGAMKPDGSDWCHVNPTPLTGGGAKIPAGDQIGIGFGTPFDNHDCCRAQGPEGLAYAPLFAVFVDNKGTARLNFFEPMKAVFDDGSVLEVSGNYPFEARTEVHFHSATGAGLKIRIPSFCTCLKCNGEAAVFQPEGYFAVQGSAELELQFDLSLKEVAAPGDSSYVAVKRGPVVLAEDSRGETADAYVHEQWRGRSLIDYASAGGNFSSDNTLAVWFKR